MSTTKLVATPRTTSGSPAARRLRAEGHIPGVLYGHGMAPISVTIERRELRVALSGPAGINTVLSLAVDGKEYPAVVKELQRHPVKRTVSHIDFLQVSMNEEIKVNVPIRIEGEAKAVLDEGLLVDPSVDTIEVICTPATMPNEFVIDVTNMQPGDVIRLADVPLPKGIVATGDPEMPVVTTLHTAAEEAEAAAEGEEGEEGEGGEGAEGGAEATGEAQGGDSSE